MITGRDASQGGEIWWLVFWLYFLLPLVIGLACLCHQKVCMTIWHCIVHQIHIVFCGVRHCGINMSYWIGLAGVSISRVHGAVRSHILCTQGLHNCIIPCTTHVEAGAKQLMLGDVAKRKGTSVISCNALEQEYAMHLSYPREWTLKIDFWMQYCMHDKVSHRCYLCYLQIHLDLVLCLLLLDEKLLAGQLSRLLLDPLSSMWELDAVDENQADLQMMQLDVMHVNFFSLEIPLRLMLHSLQNDSSYPSITIYVFPYWMRPVVSLWIFIALANQSQSKSTMSQRLQEECIWLIYLTTHSYQNRFCMTWLAWDSFQNPRINSHKSWSCEEGLISSLSVRKSLQIDHLRTGIPGCAMSNKKTWLTLQTAKSCKFSLQVAMHSIVSILGPLKTVVEGGKIVDLRQSRRFSWTPTCQTYSSILHCKHIGPRAEKGVRKNDPGV